MILILWVVGLGGYLLFDRFGPGATGTVVVHSDPPGAEIWMDLAPLNRGTPAELRELPAGKHSFTVKLPDHRPQPFVQVVEISRGSVDSVYFALDSDSGAITRNPAQIAATSPPAQMPPRQETISERVKKEEPWDVPRVVPSSVDSAGLARSTPSATDRDKEPKTVLDPLISERKPDLPALPKREESATSGYEEATGSAEISSSVPGATIIVNDKRLAQRTPAVITLPLGTHTVQVELDGYACEPEQYVVRLSRAAGAQLVYFTLTEKQRARKEVTITTDPVAGPIFVDGDSVGMGVAVVPHDFGVFLISYGDVEGFRTPEPTRLSVVPANPNPTVTAHYVRKLQVSAECRGDGSVATEGGVRWEVGLYDRNKGARVSESMGPKIERIPATGKSGWELAMGDPNRNPTGSDYIEFIFDLPEDVPPSTPLNLRLYVYRTNRKYPLSLSSRCEITVVVNGRLFLDNFRPRHDQQSADGGSYEEWSLQHTLVSGENRIMIRTGEKNQIFNYLWKFEVL
ncbi:MAG: PEGA domain-containing protein [Calditrichaeota bacterium]|nr:PEGA domain-containing protein [Calditrichota bacterium]